MLRRKKICILYFRKRILIILKEVFFLKIYQKTKESQKMMSWTETCRSKDYMAKSLLQGLHLPVS